MDIKIVDVKPSFQPILVKFDTQPKDGVISGKETLPAAKAVMVANPAFGLSQNLKEVADAEIILGQLLMVKPVDSEIQVQLRQAVEANNLEAVKKLLKSGADVNARSADGSTPLAWAVSKKQVEMVRFLLEKGADIKAKYPGGAGIMHNAAFAGNFEIAKLLLEKGADANVRKLNNGKTPLDFAKTDEMKALIGKYQK